MSDSDGIEGRSSFSLPSRSPFESLLLKKYQQFQTIIHRAFERVKNTMSKKILKDNWHVLNKNYLAEV